MKNTLSLLLVGLAATTACKKDDFLEPRTSALTEESVFTDSARTIAFQTKIYSETNFSFNKGRWSSHGSTEQATDDAEYRYSGGGQIAVILYSGTYTPLNMPNPMNDFYDTPWFNIRRCNLLLSKLQLSTTPLSARTRARMALETRFLRAWYYSQLLVSFGGMPIIGDKVYGLEDFINEPRTSYADCVKYLSDELDACAAGLVSASAQAAADYGRITSGACLALKSRILLQAASPLFNGGAETTDASLAALVSYPTYDAARWQAAANAANAVITSGQYSLVEDNTTAPGYGFYAMFLQRFNPEYIFFYNKGNNRDFEGFYFPPTRGGAWNSMPSQNIVDAFPMKNGLPITNAASGYVATNPYVGRDPRFYNSIIYNQAPLFLASAAGPAPVNTYEGAPNDGFDINGSLTGYYCRKMCDATSSANGQRGWPLLRYAEILLNYAEAINETGQPALAEPKLFDLRRRAGIDAGTNGRYGIPAGLSVAQMRDFIRNERRIELAFEDQRWHDIRRWKIAMTVNNGFNNRMRIVRAGTSPNFTYTYNIVPTIRRHNFRPEMYLLPIPDGEIRKISGFRQNPGW